jgi:cytochrome c
MIMCSRNMLLIAAAAAALAAGLRAADSDEAMRGREIYEKRCTGCHALDANKVGPPLRGVFGRRAAGDTRFPYSDALRNSKVIWDEASLDRWLTDPEALVPGNDMSFRLEQGGERAAIIAYLKTLPAKAPSR